ncbi:hypothetical protein PGT21_019476, partial [Puccinia graminis f. sp. tritici]
SYKLNHFTSFIIYSSQEILKKKIAKETTFFFQQKKEQEQEKQLLSLQTHDKRKVDIYDSPLPLPSLLLLFFSSLQKNQTQENQAADLTSS